MSTLNENCSTNERLYMDYAELELKTIKEKCREDGFKQNITLSMLAKYNQKIDEIKIILNNDDGYDCRHKLQQHLLPTRMKD